MIEESSERHYGDHWTESYLVSRDWEGGFLANLSAGVSV
jgi:hypothetical protein